MSINKARIIFFSALLSLTILLGFLPGYNGDMPFYIATSMNFEGRTEQQAFSGAREIVRNEVRSTKSDFLVENLDNAPPGMLNFYRIKPAYVYLVILFHRLGFSYILSTTLPSLISYFLIGCIAFYWLSLKFKPGTTILGSILLMVLSPMTVLARLSTPDAMSNLVIFYCLFRISFGKQYLWTVLLLLVSLFIRLDNFITVGVLLSGMYLWPVKEEKTRIPLVVYLSSGALAIAICLWINYYFSRDFFWFRQAGYIQSLPAYRHELLLYFQSFSNSLLPVIILLVGYAWLNHREEFRGRILYLITLPAVIIFIRFLFFPVFQDRFMSAFYLCGFLLILEVIGRKRMDQNFSQ